MLVKCIDVGDFPSVLTKGMVYEAEDYLYNKKCYMIRNDNGMNAPYYKSRFEEVDVKETKVQVKCIKVEEWGTHLTHGKVYTATIDGKYYKITNDLGRDNAGYSKDRFEVVKENEMKFEVGKIYVTNNATKYKVVCIDKPGNDPILAYDVKEGYVYTFDKDGYNYYRGTLKAYIEPKKWYTYVYLNDNGTPFSVTSETRPTGPYYDDRKVIHTFEFELGG